MTKKSRRRVNVYEERYTLEEAAREFYKHNKTKGLSEAAQKQYKIYVDLFLRPFFIVSRTPTGESLSTNVAVAVSFALTVTFTAFLSYKYPAAFPFFSKDGCLDALRNLRDAHILIKGSFNDSRFDHTYWHAFTGFGLKMIL